MAHGDNVVGMTRKTCSNCKQALPIANFSLNRGRSDGRTQHCRVCRSARNQIWRKANLEKHRASTRAWAAANKDRHDATNLAYRETHRAEAAANSRAWYVANKGRRVERDRVTAWERMLASSCVLSSKKRGHVCELDAAMIAGLFKSQKGLCHWTGVPMIPSVATRDPQRPSADRLDNAIGYVRGNVVLACQFANIGRQVATESRFREFLATLRETMRAT